jgi:excisionase family DNA binding protein
VKQNAIAEFVGIAEAAELVGVSQVYVRRLLEKKRLEGQKFGRDWIATRASVLAFAKRRRAHPELQRPGRKKISQGA